MTIRQPAVAGVFYPHDPVELRAQIAGLLAGNGPAERAPKVLIVPHAGYLYSGPVAAAAYSRLTPAADGIRRVVLLGPSHRVPLDGLALPGCEAFETPLGTVRLDEAGCKKAMSLEPVCVSEAAHAMEHSLEVHLPFLQTILNDFTIVPLVVGDAEADEVAQVIDTLWGGDETLIVISSDLSHFHPYEEAEALDAQTSAAIQKLDEHLTGEQACGCRAINGLMVAAKKRHMDVSLIDLCNSGDTAGGRDHVVGYGAYELH